MTKYGYIRTSTDKQLIDRQVLQLQDVCDEVYIECGVSAVKRKRPVYESLLSILRSGDVLVVISLDRAYRSVLDALSELDALHKRNVAFQSLSQNFDTQTPEGKLMYTVIAALSEWERNILSERTKQGMQAARKRGSKIGRPQKLSKSQVIWVRQKTALDNTPEKLRELSASLNVSIQTIRRAICRKSS